MGSFWEGNHELSDELSRLHDKYVPDTGDADTVEGELLLCAERIAYDLYNNGWGANNLSAFLEFLHNYGFYKEISNEDIAEGFYTQSTEDILDKGIEYIIHALQEAEKTDSFTPLPKGALDDLGLSQEEWGNLTQEDEEDYDEDDWEDENDYDDD